MTDLHGNEPVVFDYDAAGQLVTAARGAAAAIRNEKGARSRAVTVAMEQFQGYYSQLFATNARTAAGDGDQLIAALDGLATITQNLIAAAHSEDSRRATARQWYEHHEHRSTLDKIGDALFGEDSPPEGPKPPPPAALPTIPQPQPRHIGGHGSSGGTSSAVPDHLTSFASTSAAANGRIDPHQSKVASLVHTFNANTRWGQIEAGALLAAFLAWNRANDNDVRWARTIAAAFTAAGGHGGLVTLSNSGLGAALKAAGVNATRQDLAISMPQTKGFSVTTGYSLDPVNTATGNFIESETDLAFAGGSALALTRMYNSFTVEEGAFGHGWSSLAEAGLAVDDEHASLTLADGRVVVFPRLGDGWGQPVSDALWLTTLEDGSHRITGNDGSWWACSAAGRMTAYGTGPGTTVTLTHDEQGHLVEISHERGRAVTLTWTGERVSAAATSDGRTASYSYDDEGHLLSVTAPGADRTYRWDTEAHLITAVLDADGVVEVENTYDDRRRVVTQLTPHGRHVRFSYLPGRVTIIDDPDGSHANTWIADPWGRLVGVIDSDDQRQSMSYDAHGNLVVLTERDGSTTIHEYDDRSRRTRTVLPSGADFRYAYDGAGRVVSVIAGAPESPDALTTYTYDRDERNPSTITDPEGGVTTLTWELGLLKRIVDPTGVVVTYEHDEHGNVVAAIDAEGNTARLERDDVGRVVGAATPLGHRTTYAYDGAGRLARRTDPDGAVWTYAYTAAGRLATIVDPTGATTTMEHDASGEETRTIDPLGRAVDRTFDELGNVSGVTLPDGSHWAFSHDSLSRPTEITTPDGSSWTPGFDRVGTTDSLVDPTGRGVTGSVDIASGTATVSDGMTEVGIRTDSYGRALANEHADGGETIYTYDRCGRVVEIVDAEGGLTRIRRDASGRVVEITSPSGTTTRREYDSCGRLEALVDAAGGRTEFGYDADRRLVRTTLPTGETGLTQYDACGRVVATYRPGVGAARYVYDAAGRVIESKDSSNGTRSYIYDAAGQLVAAVNGNRGRTTYEYDENGRMILVRDPLGAETRREYDAMSRCTAETDPLGRTTRAGYDAAGRQIWQENPDGHRLSWTYDAAGRVASSSVDGVLQTEIVRDARARTVTVTDHTDAARTVVHTMSWNGRNQLTTRSRDGRTTTWTYDADGRRTSMTTPSGSTTSYEYGPSGRIAAISHPLLGRATLDRDASGRLVAATAGDLIQSWEYTDGFVSAHHLTTPEGSTRTQISRSEDGRIAALSLDGQTTRFDYDAACQLVTAATGGHGTTWRYDAGGRLVSESADGVLTEHTYDIAGQLLTTTRAGERTTYTYDAAGRRTSMSNTSGTTSYDWSSLGWLTSVEGEGRRTALHVDALAELARIDEVDVFHDSAARGVIQAGDTPVVAGGPITGVGTSWTTPGWRSARATESSDPWAAPAASTRVAGLPDALGIGPGGELTIHGLEWMGARVYDPASRGFLSTDPLDPVTGAGWSGNPYSYAGNDPLHALDPLGLRPATDADLRQWADAHQGWVANNWEYLAGAAMVVAGGALMLTGVGGPAGMMLLSAGADTIIQKATTGQVNWGEVAISGAMGAWGGAAMGATGPLKVAIIKGVTSGAASGAVTGAYTYMTGPGPHTVVGALEHTALGGTVGGVSGGALGAGGHGLEVAGTKLLGGKVPLPDPVPHPEPPRFIVGSDGVITDVTRPVVMTPYGPAVQDLSPAALAARQAVEHGAPIYRAGTMGKSQAAEGQFWALEHPHTPGYEARYGIPAGNMAKQDFIEQARVPHSGDFITRAAPGIGNNPGGGIEVVVPSGGADLDWFSTQ